MPRKGDSFSRLFEEVLGLQKASTSISGKPPISTDPSAKDALTKFIKERGSAPTLEALHKETNDQFAGFSNRSLSQVMGRVHPKESGSKKRKADPNELMAAARNGGKVGESVDMPGMVSPVGNGRDVAFPTMPMDEPPLYAADEDELKVHSSVFEYFIDNDVGNGVQRFIGVSIQADSLLEPKVAVVDDGWMLEIVSLKKEHIYAINALYKKRTDKCWQEMAKEDADKVETSVAKKKYDLLSARRLAEKKSIAEMKNSRGNKWKYQFLRIILEYRVEKSTYGEEIVGNEDKGYILQVDLKVIQDDHVDAKEVKRGSPMK